MSHLRLVLVLSCTLSLVACEGEAPPSTCSSGMGCGAGSWCVDGRCVAMPDSGPLRDAGGCTGGTVGCDGGCVDIQTDPSSCGTCGRACADSEECVTGLCSPLCAAGETRCGFECPMLGLSLEHCGSCGTACEAGQLCAMGACCSPGRPPIEVCNGVDDDCDGVVDLPECDPTLVAWYRFERGENAVLDSSGGGNHGMALGSLMRGVPGRDGAGIFFDGAAATMVEVADSPSLVFGSTLTAEAWIKPMDCSHPGSNHNTVAAIEAELLFAFDTTCQSASYVNNGTTWAIDSPGVAVTPGQWQHYAYTWDGATIRSYLDGDPLGPGTPFGTAMIDTGNRLFLGARPDCCVQTFRGTIDDLRLYVAVRTREQICADAGGAVVDGDCVIP